MSLIASNPCRILPVALVVFLAMGVPAAPPVTSAPLTFPAASTAATRATPFAAGARSQPFRAGDRAVGAPRRVSSSGGAYPANAGAPRGARSVASIASGTGFAKALAAYRADVGRYPGTSEGLYALIRRPAGVTNWRGPYIAVTNPARPFADPWGNDYRLVITPLPGSPSYSVAIKSDGPDGVPDTADDLSVSF